MSNATQTTEKKEVKKTFFKMVKHEEFVSTIGTNLMTTQELGSLINGFFRPVFVDYEGCIISILPTGALGLTLYFRNKEVQVGDGQIKNLINRNAKDNNTVTMIDKINTFNAMYSRKRMYDLTDDTKEALETFFDGPAKVNWNQVSTEQTYKTNNFTNNYNVLMVVSGLSLNRVLRFIYGSKDENGMAMQYDTKVMRPINADPNNFIISVMQLNNDVLERFATKLGVINNTTYNLPIITG